MTKVATNLKLQAIVVGGSADEFVRNTMSLLEDCGIESVLCEDVYSAVGKLSAKKGASGVVIGRLGKLSREQGRFFHIASGNGFVCCCLVDKDLAGRRRQVMDAIETGAFVVAEPAEIEEVLAELLGGGGARSGEQKGSGKALTGIGSVVEKILTGGQDGPSGNDRTSKFLKSEFLTTKEELDALFGA